MSKPKARLEHPWYNFNKLLSHNAVINIVAGGRGIGKTFGAEHKAIKDALRSGDQFIYTRRYDTEQKLARATFFDAVGLKFPDWNFRVEGFESQAVHASTIDDKKRPWKPIGYHVPLSKAQQFKSVPFPNVRWIIFDEFIIEDSTQTRYLKDEVNALLNFYNTVDRYQDRVRVLMLANSVSIMNPYFTDWGIKPMDNEVHVSDDGFLAWHFPPSAEFAESIKRTRFARFIEGSDYEKYAVHNQFKDNNDALVRIKSPDDIYRYTLETPGGTFSVWRNKYNGDVFVGKRRVGNERMATMIASRVDVDKPLWTYSQIHLSNLRDAYRRGVVFFDDPSTRNTFAEIFKR